MYSTLQLGKARGSEGIGCTRRSSGTATTNKCSSGLGIRGVVVVLASRLHQLEGNAWQAVDVVSNNDRSDDEDEEDDEHDEVQHGVSNDSSSAQLGLLQ